MFSTGIEMEFGTQIENNFTVLVINYGISNTIVLEIP